MDGDGLLAAGVAGVQLTWMDARVGDRVITPRIGKPVEIQALWLNALAIASRLDRRWRMMLERGRATFSERFFDEGTGGLADVVDVDHVSGTRDLSCWPNQVLAIGGLPLTLLDRARARRLVDLVEARHLTPARPAIARTGRTVIRAPLRGRLVVAGRGLPPGHGVAVADGAVRRSVDPRARQHGRGEAHGAIAISRAAAAAPRDRGTRAHL